mgnify:CR=1 FL=1
MYLAYLQNDFIFSALFGVLALICTFVDSRRTKEKYSFKTYIKIAIGCSLSVYIALYIKSTSLLNFDLNTSSESLLNKQTKGGGSVNLDNYSNVNIGEPNF